VDLQPQVPTKNESKDQRFDDDDPPAHGMLLNNRYVLHGHYNLNMGARRLAGTVYVSRGKARVN